MPPVTLTSNSKVWIKQNWWRSAILKSSPHRIISASHCQPFMRSSTAIRNKVRTIGLVKDGHLTLPGELLAYLVAIGGVLTGKQSCVALRAAGDSRYRARIVASGIVRKGNVIGELRLIEFQPWMIGLPSSFLIARARCTASRALYISPRYLFRSWPHPRRLCSCDAMPREI